MRGQREQRNGKKKAPFLIGIGICAAVIVLVIALAVRTGGDPAPSAGEGSPLPGESAPLPESGESPSAAPDLSPWLIGGDDPETALTRPYAVLDEAVPDTGLVLESVGQYTGPNLEDGQDTPTGNAASVVVRNDSGQVVQYAMLTLQAGEETVQFKVTTLPPGSRVQAIALDGQAYRPDDVYTYVSCDLAYGGALTRLEELFTVSGEAGSLSLTNNSGKSYEHVSVYYKYRQGDLYLGGITYRCTFEQVAPGETLQQTAGHYDPASSEIMMLTTDEST